MNITRILPSRVGLLLHETNTGWVARSPGVTPNIELLGEPVVSLS